MTRVTTDGLEMRGRCPALTSVMWAPAQQGTPTRGTSEHDPGEQEDQRRSADRRHRVDHQLHSRNRQAPARIERDQQEYSAIGTAAAEPDDVLLDLHTVACICRGFHVTDFVVLTHDPVGSAPPSVAVGRGAPHRADDLTPKHSAA